jgi:hypothetical protein
MKKVSLHGQENFFKMGKSKGLSPQLQGPEGFPAWAREQQTTINIKNIMLQHHVARTSTTIGSTTAGTPATAWVPATAWTRATAWTLVTVGQ